MWGLLQTQLISLLDILGMALVSSVCYVSGLVLLSIDFFHL